MSDTEPLRAEGPAVSVHGTQHRHRVVVLDPAGASKHDELPATWRPLTDEHEIVWVRMPATEAGDCDRALRGAGDPRPDDGSAAGTAATARTDVLASGPYGRFALDLARRHPSAVRAVLLVDPAADGATDSDRADQADDVWLRRYGSEVAAVREEGIVVEVIAHSSTDDEDRVPPPLPLGHPRVVTALQEAFERIPGVRDPAS